MKKYMKTRNYVVGYFNKAATKEDFVILATMDSVAVAMFIRDSYNESYERIGLDLKTVVLASHEVPEDYRWSKV